MHIYMHRPTCILAYICTYVHTYKHTYTRACAYIHAYVAYIERTSIHMFVNIYVVSIDLNYILTLYA